MGGRRNLDRCLRELEHRHLKVTADPVQTRFAVLQNDGQRLAHDGLVSPLREGRRVANAGRRHHAETAVFLIDVHQRDELDLVGELVDLLGPLVLAPDHITRTLLGFDGIDRRLVVVERSCGTDPRRVEAGLTDHAIHAFLRRREVLLFAHGKTARRSAVSVEGHLARTAVLNTLPFDGVDDREGLRLAAGGLDRHRGWLVGVIHRCRLLRRVAWLDLGGRLGGRGRSCGCRGGRARG